MRERRLKLYHEAMDRQERLLAGHARRLNARQVRRVQHHAGRAVKLLVKLHPDLLGL